MLCAGQSHSNDCMQLVGLPDLVPWQSARSRAVYVEENYQAHGCGWVLSTDYVHPLKLSFGYKITGSNLGFCASTRLRGSHLLSGA